MKTLQTVSYLFFGVLLGGCAAEPVPAPNVYLLRPQTAPPAASALTPVLLDRIAVAPYLDADGIVVETEPGVVYAARQHRWAEPLDHAVKRYLQVALREALGRPVVADLQVSEQAAQRIDVIVHQLHATMLGEVALVAEYRIVGAGSDPVLYEFDAVERLEVDGYTGIVEAHRRLLDALAREIAGALQR